MKIEDRLNNILKSNGLQARSEPKNVSVVAEAVVAEAVVAEAVVAEAVVAEVCEPEMIQFNTLKQMIKAANKMQPDEDGVRVGCVKSVGLDEMKLPMVRGKFIIDDIQKSDNGYEVHLVENLLHERQI
jgi:hypothetical protein